MERRKFKIADIENYLDEIGFEWVDNLIYNSITRRYIKANMTHFKGLPKSLLLRNKTVTTHTLALVTVTNDEFTIKKERSKLDASVGWREYLLEKGTSQTV